MIRIKKAERIIKSAGGLNKAKTILDNLPDQSAFYFQSRLGMYARTSMSAVGLVTEVYILPNGWVLWANPNNLIKLSDLRRAVVMFEQKDSLFSAANDDPVAPISVQVMPRLSIGHRAVYINLLKSDDVLTVKEIRKSSTKGVSYILAAPNGKEMHVQESCIRGAMAQERLIGKRVNHIDEALTRKEVSEIRRALKQDKSIKKDACYA